MKWIGVMRTVLGVDAGGTSTRCVWLDETGRCLGVGRSGPGNPLSSGSDIALLSLSAAVGTALACSDEAAPELIMVTMAGGGSIEQGSVFDDLPQRLGLRAELRVSPDLLSAYCSGRADSPGYLLLAGTGAVAGRVEDGELTAISDGLGWLIGDEGSGFWIGREAVVAVARSMDGRGPQTSLAAEVAADFGWEFPSRGRRDVLGEVTALLEGVYQRRRPVELARFAPAVLRLADSDEVANDIVDRAAAALLRTWSSVRSEAAVGPTVLAGGVLSAPSPLRARVQAALDDTIVVTDGLAGAGLLALRALGVPSGEAQRTRIVASLASA